MKGKYKKYKNKGNFLRYSLQISHDKAVFDIVFIQREISNKSNVWKSPYKQIGNMQPNAVYVLIENKYIY